MCKCCEEIEFWKENIDNRQQMKSRIIIKSIGGKGGEVKWVDTESYQ